MRSPTTTPRRGTILLAAGLLLAGCNPFGGSDGAAQTEAGATPVAWADIGDPILGAELIHQNGCTTCHAIPGIGLAEGIVGPPLAGVGRRVYLAGMLPNTPENMLTWLRDPQAVVPGNAMPDVGLTADEARHVAAYLYTLR